MVMLVNCLLFYYLYMILTNFHRVLYKGLQSIWMTATGSKDKMNNYIVLVDSEHGRMDNILILWKISLLCRYLSKPAQL